MHMYVYIYIASTSLFYFMCVSREFSTGKPQIHAVHASEFARKVGCKCKVMLCRQWVVSKFRPMKNRVSHHIPPWNGVKCPVLRQSQTVLPSNLGC